MDLLWRANEKVGSESPNTLQVPESGQVNIKQTGHKINLFFHLGGGFLFLICPFSTPPTPDALPAVYTPDREKKEYRIDRTMPNLFHI